MIFERKNVIYFCSGLVCVGGHVCASGLFLLPNQPTFSSSSSSERQHFGFFDRIVCWFDWKPCLLMLMLLVLDQVLWRYCRSFDEMFMAPRAPHFRVTHFKDVANTSEWITAVVSCRCSCLDFHSKIYFILRCQRGKKHIWMGEMMLWGFDGGVQIFTRFLISAKFELCFEFKCSWFNFSMIRINEIQISRISMIGFPQFSIHWYPAADKRPQEEGGSHCGLVACFIFVVGDGVFKQIIIFWNLRALSIVFCFIRLAGSYFVSPRIHWRSTVVIRHSGFWRLIEPFSNSNNVVYLFAWPGFVGLFFGCP